METNKLPKRILIGLLLGALLGGLAQWYWGSGNETLKIVTKDYIHPLGTIFLNMIFMIVVPLLFSALALGVAEIGDARKVGRVGARCLLMTVILSGIAVAIGLTLVNVVRPGGHISIAQRDNLMNLYGKKDDAIKKVDDSKKAEGFVQTIVNFIPKNPLESATKANEGGLLGFMVFTLLFGVALASISPEKALPVKVFLEGIFAISLRVIEMAMTLAPYCIFLLLFAAAAQLNYEAFLALGKYALLVLFALAFHMIVVYSLALKLVAKRNPLEFFRQIRTVIGTAFATSSSNATLPTALKVSEEEVGLPRDISSFVLTIGATANQNGTALFEGITVLFLAQISGVELGVTQQIIVMGWCILAGIGTAGVPGGSWPMIAIILYQIGVPPEMIGLCLGIDRILDMSRTTLNVSGDIVIAACVTEMEGRRPVLVEA